MCRKGRPNLDKQCKRKPDVGLVTRRAEALGGIEVDGGGKGAAFRQRESRHLGIAGDATELVVDRRGQAGGQLRCTSAGLRMVSTVPAAL
jgi:hypothetical protein